MRLPLLLLLVAPSVLSRGRVNRTSSGDERKGRLFSLFNVVQFKNNECVSQSALSDGSTSNRNGTCYTSTECTSNGGTASGNCAAGFGVCCLFLVDTCSATINRNATYIRNPGFPQGYTETTGCTFTVDKEQNDVCSLRLDFETFTIAGPADSLETMGGNCQDTFTTTVASSGLTFPVICGQNRGQHIYLDLGADSGDSATLAFGVDSNVVGVTRQWEIKVLQIPCTSPLRPPDGCYQYATGITGTWQTFNFLDQTTSNLANHDYTQCVRQELGFCCIKYQVCNGENNAFTLGTQNQALPGMSKVDSLCVTRDYITIEGASNMCNNIPLVAATKFCGTLFSTKSNGDVASDTVCDCVPPFEIHVHTDGKDEAGASADPGTNANTVSRGNCLSWQQLPC